MNDIPVLTLSENDTVVVPGMHLTKEERAFVDGLKSPEYGNLNIDEMRDGLRIKATSWVGVIRLPTFEVHVIPKLDAGFTGLVELVDYVDDLGLLRSQKREIATHTGDGLLELVAILFTDACEKVLKRGICSGYVVEESELPVLRGRFLPVDTLLKQMQEPAQLVCRYDERTTDIPENQYVALALRVCAYRTKGKETSRRMRRLRSLFENLCTPEGLAHARRDTDFLYTRLNEHYKRVHNLARLVLTCFGISDVFTHSSARCYAFMVDMAVYFERFVRRWLEGCLKGTDYRLAKQRSNARVISDLRNKNRRYQIIPDAIIQSKGYPKAMLPLDAKYKQYDQENRKVDQGDIYQTFLYALTLEQGHLEKPVAIIVYPKSTDATDGISILEISRQDNPIARVYVYGVEISKAIKCARDKQPSEGAPEIIECIDQMFKERPTLPAV